MLITIQGKRGSGKTLFLVRQLKCHLDIGLDDEIWSNVHLNFACHYFSDLDEVFASSRRKVIGIDAIETYYDGLNSYEADMSLLKHIYDTDSTAYLVTSFPSLLGGAILRYSDFNFETTYDKNTGVVKAVQMIEVAQYCGLYDATEHLNPQ